MKFKTETGLLFKLAILASTLATLVLAFQVLKSDDVMAPALALIIMAGTTYTLIQLTRSTYYQIDIDKLKIRSPLYNTDIPINDIRSIVSSRSWIASPAASLDRIEIQHAKGSILISPENRNEFLQEIKTINPEINIQIK